MSVFGEVWDRVLASVKDDVSKLVWARIDSEMYRGVLIEYWRLDNITYTWTTAADDIPLINRRAFSTLVQTRKAARAFCQMKLEAKGEAAVDRT